MEVHLGNPFAPETEPQDPFKGLLFYGCAPGSKQPANLQFTREFLRHLRGLQHIKGNYFQYPADITADEKQYGVFGHNMRTNSSSIVLSYDHLRESDAKILFYDCQQSKDIPTPIEKSFDQMTE